MESTLDVFMCSYITNKYAMRSKINFNRASHTKWSRFRPIKIFIPLNLNEQNASAVCSYNLIKYNRKSLFFGNYGENSSPGVRIHIRFEIFAILDFKSRKSKNTKISLLVIYAVEKDFSSPHCFELLDNSN